jgi:hypothetical protein
MKRIHSLKGLEIALTGNCGLKRHELTRLIKRKGGKVTGYPTIVTKNTDILVRGSSPFWKHGDFGTKEKKAAELISLNHPISVILSEDLDRLLNGQSVKEIQFVAGNDVDLLRAEAELQSFNATSENLDLPIISSRRLEQARLRQLHFGSKKSVRCSLCGRLLPRNLLVVGHIKPRSRCTPAERRDMEHIAMPICLLGCDTLFDRGYVSVSDKGRIITSIVKGNNKPLHSMLSQLNRRSCPNHTSDSEHYFSWHRDNIFNSVM